MWNMCSTDCWHFESEKRKVKKGFGRTEAYGEKKDEDGFGRTEAY